MKNSVKRFSVVIGFSALVILLLINGAVIRRGIEAQVDAHYWVEHTQQVLLELAQIDSLLTQAESGQRGFLYTGSEQYLEPHARASAELESHIRHVAALTADNPMQQARIAQLRELTQHKLAELAETIKFHHAGDTDAARALVESDDGLLTMQQIRALLADMEQEEVTLESRRTQDYARSVKRTVGSVYATTAIAILGLGFLVFYILREIRLREKHAEQIRQREEWFRTTLTSIGDGVIATDERGRVTFINPIAERLAGTSLAQCRGRDVQSALPLFNETTHKPVDNPVSIVMQKGVIVGLANHTVLKRPDGTTIPIEDSAAPFAMIRESLSEWCWCFATLPRIATRRRFCARLRSLPRRPGWRRQWRTKSTILSRLWATWCTWPRARREHRNPLSRTCSWRSRNWIAFRTSPGRRLASIANPARSIQWRSRKSRRASSGFLTTSYETRRSG